jgi:carboxyl-terminal processing protease
VENIIVEGRKSVKEEVSPEDESQTIGLVRRMLKALIARDLWDMSEYFAIVYQDDDMVAKALELIGE